MCIIVIKPKGRPFPSDSVLNYCFRRNPHGAGIMLAAPKRGLIIRKGLMTREEFFDCYHDLAKRFPESPFIIHFRWSTGGGIQPGLCHPFPIDNRRRVLTAKQPSNVKMAVAHNGIISRWSEVDDTVSDTLLYVKNVLFPAYKADPEFVFQPEQKAKIANAVNGSRLAFPPRSHKPLEPKRSWSINTPEAFCLIIPIAGFIKTDSVKIIGFSISVKIQTRALSIGIWRRGFCRSMNSFAFSTIK